MERLLQSDLQYSGEQAKAQVAFIPNKSIIENTVPAQETIYCFKT